MLPNDHSAEKGLESSLGEETLPLYHPMFTTPERNVVRAFVQSGPKQWKEVQIELGPELGKLGQELMAQFTKEEIERNTLREVAIQTQNEKIRKQMAEDRALHQERETLFQAKAAALDIEEVKNHPDAALRAKIRKAKNLFEVGAWVNVVLQRSLDAKP